MNDSTRKVGRIAAWGAALVLGTVMLSDLAQAETAPPPAAVRAQAEKSSSASPRASASPRPDRSGTPKPKPSDGERRRKPAHHRGGHRMLHGETVVQTETGTATHVVQRGIVTAVSSTSITVRSADGYSLTWTRDADTKVRTAPKDQEQRPLRVGDDVMAHGVRRSASSVVARQVRVVPEGARDGRPDGPRGEHPEGDPAA